MLVIFQSLNFFSIIPALFLATVFDVYYIRCSDEIHHSSIFQRYKRYLPIKFLPIESSQLLGSLRLYDFGIEAVIYHRVEQLLTQKILLGIDKEFQGITKLDSKLRLILATQLNYMDTGLVALFLGERQDYRSVYFVHTSVQSYCYRISNQPKSVRLHHIFFPVENFLNLWIKIKKIFGRLIKRLFTPQERNKTSNMESSFSGVSTSDTAIIFHQSTWYGKLFKKNHYFSPNKKSRLHLLNVQSFVLNRQESAINVEVKDEIKQHDFIKSFSWKNVFKAARFLISNVNNIHSFNEFFGIVFLVQLYYQKLCWSDSISKYPNLKNVIIDYDILFPKALSLALEARGIRTIAIQERGSASFAYIYGVICDVYLLCGGIFTKYGESNQSIACEKYIDFGAWRNVLFHGDELPSFKELNIQKYGEIDIGNFKTVIAALGWFVSEPKFGPCPFTNYLANIDFYIQIKNLALMFPESAIVIRLKILSDKEREIITGHFAGFRNIFLCDEYAKANASYSLCKRADVIVSLQTSLADECLAAGKKVVLLDSTHNFKRICTDIYPEEFHFAFAHNTEIMLSLVKRCMNGDAALEEKYNKLRNQLAGKFDLTTPNIISNTLENFLL